MNATRAKFDAQDKILKAIAALVKDEPELQVAGEIGRYGAKLAKSWGVNFPDLPDTRRSAA